MADMLKNPSKATKFHSDTHDCKSHSKCFLDRSWLATLEVFKESLAGIFHHICHVSNANLMQLMSKVRI